jgi:hypothetical protein
MDLDPTLAHLRALFADFGVEWCIAGAIAANAYRPPRDTTDLDLVVQIPASQYESIAAALTRAGWKTVRVSPEGAYPDVVRLAHDSFFPTDLLLSKTAYQREALTRARPVGPHSVRVLTVEDVIIHKLIAYRYRDRDDVVEILRAAVARDEAYVERWAKEWEVLDRWHELRRELALMPK